ncbi:MAG: hypothetical protein C4531_15280 [Desulfurivibrio sp.]|nr:MAG: hypothetical protein C4531_15280 [Desulfurivibrio sp.]
MTSDISQFLNFEIKKELADRYFGFRKLIEEDKALLEKDIYHHTRTVGQRIVYDLNRIYIMLQDEKLIRRFLAVTGLEENFFYDPYILTSPTLRTRIFAGVKPWGLTAAGRFKHLFMTTYEQLILDVAEYREKFAELVDSQETIEEEIKIFYRKNDISTIMGFLRTMDAAEKNGNLEGAIATGFSEYIDRAMRVAPPVKVSGEIPFIPPPVPLPQIKKELKKLAEAAFPLHGDGFQLPRSA